MNIKFKNIKILGLVLTTNKHLKNASLDLNGEDVKTIVKQYNTKLEEVKKQNEAEEQEKKE